MSSSRIGEGKVDSSTRGVQSTVHHLLRFRVGTAEVTVIDHLKTMPRIENTITIPIDHNPIIDRAIWSTGERQKFATILATAEGG